MDLFVDPSDSKLQPSNKYQKLVKINKKRKKTKSDDPEEKSKSGNTDNKQDKPKSSTSNKNDKTNTIVKKGDKPANKVPKKEHKSEHLNPNKNDKSVHSDIKREKSINLSPKKYKPGNSNFKSRGKHINSSAKVVHESKESSSRDNKSPITSNIKEDSIKNDESPPLSNVGSDSSRDKEPHVSLNTLIESCTEVVRSSNTISNPVYREIAASTPNAKKLSSLKEMYKTSMHKIENMIKKLTSDHVFDDNTSYIDVLFDEIEYGLKKHNRTEYSRELLDPPENTKQQNKSQSQDESMSSGVKNEFYRTEKSLKNYLINLENSTISKNNIEVDLSNYNTEKRPQDQWKNHYDNFSTRFNNHSRIKKFNKIEPQVNYSSAYRDTKFFEKGFVPKIYPKHEFLSLIDEPIHVNPHLYSQELNSLFWSEDKKNSTHQGFNILGGTANNLLASNVNGGNNCGVSFSSLNGPANETVQNKIDYKLIDNESDFNSMLEKLKNSRILSMDVEHHDTETYRGFICLLQLSTPQENYIIDPFKIFGKMNKLNRLTTDPKILKIMHGACNDVVWLQRDFNIFVVNLFDTREAAIVLNLPEQSLGKLVQKYFNIKLNKRFQISDWSKRPLDDEMLDYACCDSHYLIPLYNTLKDEILSKEDGRVKIIQVMNNGRETCLKQYVDRGPEIYRKFKSISKRHKIKIPELDFVSYNLLLNIIAFRNFLARKLDKSEKLIIRDYQIALIIKRMKLGNYNYLVSNLCEFFNGVKYEIEHIIKIKNSIEMIYKKLKSKELMLIKPEPIYYIMSCMDSKGGNVNLGEFNKLVKSQYYLLITQKHSPCILNTIKVYNKFVVGGFFNNVSPAEHHVNETNEPQSQPNYNLQPQYTPIHYKKHELTGVPQNTSDEVEMLAESNVENEDKQDKMDDVEEDEDTASEDENKRSLVEESNLLSKWKRKKL